MAHGTVERYAEGCRCSRCVLAVAATEQEPLRRRKDERGRFVKALPPPSTFARCRRGCGRLVWDFDAGLCGACGSESEAA